MPTRIALAAPSYDLSLELNKAAKAAAALSQLFMKSVVSFISGREIEETKLGYFFLVKSFHVVSSMCSPFKNHRQSYVRKSLRSFRARVYCM